MDRQPGRAPTQDTTAGDARVLHLVELRLRSVAGIAAPRLERAAREDASA